jgi:hypothetical protein
MNFLKKSTHYVFESKIFISNNESEFFENPTIEFHQG